MVDGPPRRAAPGHVAPLPRPGSRDVPNPSRLGRWAGPCLPGGSGDAPPPARIARTWGLEMGRRSRRLRRDRARAGVGRAPPGPRQSWARSAHRRAGSRCTAKGRRSTRRDRSSWPAPAASPLLGQQRRVESEAAAEAGLDRRARRAARTTRSLSPRPRHRPGPDRSARAQSWPAPPPGRGRRPHARTKADSWGSDTVPWGTRTATARPMCWPSSTVATSRLRSREGSWDAPSACMRSTAPPHSTGSTTGRHEVAAVQRAVMADVAAEAGVSVMTVSRVLNDFPGVADETRHRVDGRLPHSATRRTLRPASWPAGDRGSSA